jgi:hypothetical protein
MVRRGLAAEVRLLPIEIRIVDGEACPVIVCDISGEIIRDYTKAHAAWSEAEGPKKGQVFFCIKDYALAPEFRATAEVIHRRCEAWYPLEIFLYWLGLNTCYSERVGKAAAKASQCSGNIP